MSKAFFCAVAFSVATSSAFAEPLYTAYPLDPNFVGQSINDQGQIVGVYNLSYAAIFDNGQIHGFSPPFYAGSYNYAVGINDAGQVAVNLYGSTYEGYLYSGGTYTPLIDNAGQKLAPTTISPTGAVGGYVHGSNGAYNGAGVYQNGSIQSFGQNTSFVGFNSAGDFLINNYSAGSGGTIHHANGSTTDIPLFPGAENNLVTGFNASGDVIGTAVVNGHGSEFIYAKGQFTTLPPSASLYYSPTLITDDGTVFGSVWPPGSTVQEPSNAFIYKDNTFTLLDNQNIANNPGIGIGLIMGMDAKGNLLTKYYDKPYPGTLHSALLVPAGGQYPFPEPPTPPEPPPPPPPGPGGPLPEPTTLTLLPLALLALRLRFGRSH